MNVHLVDATFELFRAYFARPAERGPDGRPVNAVRGLMDSMLSLLREPDVTHIAAATDYVITSWRNDVFAGYKTEAGVPRELLSQFRDAERGLRSLGILTWPMVEDEADDGLATAVERFVGDRRVGQVVICSVDKDLAQCVRDAKVVLRDRMRDVTYDEVGVVAKFGVHPASIPDYLALVGDSADGYPGLPGWGSKSAAAVLTAFGHLEAIPDEPLDWHLDIRSAGRLAITLRDRRDEALLYRRLATLNRDSEISGSLEELEWQGVPRSAFESFAAELGLEGIGARVHRWA